MVWCLASDLLREVGQARVQRWEGGGRRYRPPTSGGSMKRSAWSCYTGFAFMFAASQV